VVAFGLGFASWNVERSELVLRQMAKPHGVVMKSLDAENVIEICGTESRSFSIRLIRFHFATEEYIVGWAREMPANRPFRIVVHFPDRDANTRASTDLIEAFGRYFAGRAAALHGDLNELFRVGRRSLGPMRAIDPKHPCHSISLSGAPGKTRRYCSRVLSSKIVIFSRVSFDAGITMFPTPSRATRVLSNFPVAPPPG
jgi:hypothetical protein